MPDTEVITLSTGEKVTIPLCPTCGLRPAIASVYFRRSNPAKFCSCPMRKETAEEREARVAEEQAILDSQDSIPF
jgi:hypothetical protein